MGSCDTSTHISVVTLDDHWESSGQSIAFLDPSNFSVESRYNGYGVSTDCAISWSGKGLKEEDGWYDLANGSLFVRVGRYSDYFDPFGGIKEQRDDVELIGDEFVYSNGYTIRGTWDLAVYHMIFPQYFIPTKIDYLCIDGLEMVHTRVVANRAIITWVYKHTIQLRIAFKRPESRNITPSSLYKLATDRLPEHAEKSKFVQEIKRGTTNELLAKVPDVLRIIGF